jgi:hypothetical protein
MKQNSELKQYLSGLTELPEDMLLGRLVMFTISETGVLRSDMERWFDELGMNTRFLPAEPRKVDAFKKATQEINEHEYPLADGTTAVLLTRKVATNREELMRGVVREIRDSKYKKLSHAIAITTTFYKPKLLNGSPVQGSERVRLTRINDDLRPEEIPHIDAALHQMRDRYDHHCQFMDANKVRDVVRRYLKYLNALEVKGGVYFVNQNRTSELVKLQDMVSRCGGGCRMDLIPLVDMANERDLIIEAFQREAEESLLDLVKEITHIESTRSKVTPEAYAKAKAKYDNTMSQAKEYQRTLGLTQSRTADAAELALDSLTMLQKRLL